MKMKTTKRWIALAVSAALSIGTAMSAFAGQWHFDGPENWQWKYQNDDGSYASSSWQLINEKWYHFDENGYLDCGIYHEGEGEEKKAYYLEWQDPSRIGELRYDIVSPYYCIKPGSGEIEAYAPEEYPEIAEPFDNIHMMYNGQDTGIIMPEGWYKDLYKSIYTSREWNQLTDGRNGRWKEFPCNGEYLQDGGVPVMTAAIWGVLYGEGVEIAWSYNAENHTVRVEEYSNGTIG